MNLNNKLGITWNKMALTGTYKILCKLYPRSEVRELFVSQFTLKFTNKSVQLLN